MQWDRLLTSKRLGQEDRQKSNGQEFVRTQFQRDYDRIIFCSPFRRLQNKTQVFPLPGSIFVHNRLTHSLEVASVGRSLGNIVSERLIKQGNQSPLMGEIGTIVSAACLAHDLGNPPFGHAGEDAISNYFIAGNGKNLIGRVKTEQWSDLVKFEGNANALRILTHQFNGRQPGGFQLTYPTLASIVKYPCVSSLGHDKSSIHRKKYGFFHSEIETFDKIADKLGLIKSADKAFYRYPLVYLVEAADDICYNIIDLEDAQRLKIVSFETTKELLLQFFNHLPAKDKKRMHETLDSLAGDPNEQLTYLRAKTIGLLVNECADVFIQNETEILEGKFDTDLIKMVNSNVAAALKEVQKISVEKIYRHRSVVEIEIAGYKVLGGLMNEFCDAILNPNSPINKKLISLIPKQYLHDGPVDDYLKIQSVQDFVSGMTDLYAVDLYKKIKGISMDLV